MRLKEMHGCVLIGIAKDFSGNKQTAIYQFVVQDLLNSYKAVGCNMSLEIHFM